MAVAIERSQHNRFKDAPWYAKLADYSFVLVGGAGGIGSWTSLLLARAGFNLVVYDNDILEEHNLGGQLYPKKSIGLSKVVALQTLIKEFSDDHISVFNERITEESMSNPFCISGFDNMKARKDMFKKWADTFVSKSSPDVNPDAIFIDGRLAAEHIQILCVRANDIEKVNKYWTEYIFDDKDVEDAPCTLKQTSHAAAMIAAHMVGFFTNHITNITEKDTTRAVPFYWEYFIPMNFVDEK